MSPTYETAEELHWRVDDATKTAFLALVAAIESCGVKVRDRWEDKEEDRSGVFLPYETGGPTITISRPRCDLHGNFPDHDWTPTEPQAQDALFTLAHEYGHFLSWRADEASWKLVHDALVRRHQLRTWEEPGMSTENRKILFDSFPAETQRLIVDGLSAEDRKLILDEEERAWALGREHVPEGLRSAYDEHGRQKLNGYREGLRPDHGGRR
jgi:hypothetical protein